MTTATATRNDVHSKAINFEDVHSGLPRCHEGRFTFSRALNFGEHVLGYLSPFVIFAFVFVFVSEKCEYRSGLGPDCYALDLFLLGFSLCFDGFCL